MKVKSLSRVRLFVTPWTVAHQAPQSMGFSRQEYWSGLPFPSSGDLPNPGMEPGSPALQTDALPSEPPGNPEVNKGTPNRGLICQITLLIPFLQVCIDAIVTLLCPTLCDLMDYIVCQAPLSMEFSRQEYWSG